MSDKDKDEKRIKFFASQIQDECPNCRKMQSWSMLQNPVSDSSQLTLSFTCDACGANWSIEGNLNFTIKL